MTRKRKLRILVLMHETLVPPESVEGLTDKQVAPFKTEYDVVVTLKELGHDVRPLGVASDLGVLREAITEFNPHITFNLLEEFHGVAVYDQHVVSYLELMKRRYTGCNPRGLMLAHDKALSKQILSYHRIRVPEFGVFPLGRQVRKRRRRLAFPLLVKSLTEEGSVGIAQASIVHDDEQLTERVRFLHEKLETDVIAEQYIEGRELYVGVLGNQRLQTLPVWELTFDNPGDAPLIATSKVKWDTDYQEKRGIRWDKAGKLPDGAQAQIERLCKRAYRYLFLTGYARMDLRLTPDGRIFLIEANPNPELSYGGEFAESAESAKMDYDELLTRIIKLGLSYRAQWQV